MSNEEALNEQLFKPDDNRELRNPSDLFKAFKGDLGLCRLLVGWHTFLVTAFGHVVVRNGVAINAI